MGTVSSPLQLCSLVPIAPSWEGLSGLASDQSSGSNTQAIFQPSIASISLSESSNLMTGMHLRVPVNAPDWGRMSEVGLQVYIWDTKAHWADHSTTLRPVSVHPDYLSLTTQPLAFVGSENVPR